MAKETVGEITFTSIDNDVNGNPRYVFHFLRLAKTYERALEIAKTLKGKKFHNKKYGGGIVVQSFNLQATADRINQLSENKD